MGSGAANMKSKNLEPIRPYVTLFQKGDAFYCKIDRGKYKLENEILINFEKLNSFSRDQDFDNFNYKTKSTNFK